jgi:hypothetical protein
VVVHVVVDFGEWYGGSGVGVAAICGVGCVGVYGGWGIWCVVAMVVNCVWSGFVVFWVGGMLFDRLPLGFLTLHMWVCGPAISYILVLTPSRPSSLPSSCLHCLEYVTHFVSLICILRLCWCIL